MPAKADSGPSFADSQRKREGHGTSPSLFPPPETFEKFSRCGHFPSPMVTMDREGHGAVAGFNAGDDTRSARRVGLRK